MIISPTSFQQATLYYNDPSSESVSRTSIKPPDNFEKRSFVRSLDAFSAYFKNLSKSLTETVNVEKISSLTYASETSSAGLTFEDTSSPTTLKSTESINTTLSGAYAPDQPTFSGSSTSDPLVSGTYDGSLGADTLTITVTQEGNVGGPYTDGLGLFPADLELEVRSSDNTLIDTISFSESDYVDTPYALSIGMSIEFSGGSIELGDSFSIGLTQDDIETADPSGSMNEEIDGSSNANFDPGLFVVDGSFDINGVTIDVDETLSIDDLVASITASAAGVTASYNAVTDELELSQKTTGSTGQIVLANDTSGFFDAVKLSGAVAVPGTDSATDSKIQDVPELSSLLSGNITINGVSVSIDIVNDSLQDVFTRINESEAEATASFSGGYLTIRSTRVDLGLQLQDSGTNFFDVFSMEVGTFDGENVRAIHGLRKGAETLKKQLGKFDDKLSNLLLAEENPKTSADAESIREGLKSSILLALKNTLNIDPSELETNGTIDTGMGITFDFSESAENIIDVNYNKMLDSLRKNPRLLMKFIFQEEGGQKEAGLLDSIEIHLDTSKRRLANALGANSGLNLDVFA